MTNRYFTADTHFHHEGIIKMMARVAPSGALFTCAEEHDQFILDQINATVGKYDELIILGDFAFNKPGKYRQRIICRNVRFLIGNHDKVQVSKNVFGQTPDVIRTRVYNKSGNDYIKVFCTHYPNAFWDGSHKEWGNLYGHCHGMREEYLDKIEPQRRGLDVGLDNAYRLFGEFRPFVEWEIYDYMAKRSGHDDVRFYQDYQMGLYLERGLL